MSVQAITWAYAQDVHPTAAKFVLVTLANRADADGYCWTSQKRLAKDTGQSDRSVREHLSALEERGLIKRTSRRRKDGTRASDGFDLDWQEDNRKISPVDEASTGKSRRANRKISPDQPENLAGCSIEEPNKESNKEPNARAREAPGHEGRASARGSGTNGQQAPEPDPAAKRRKQASKERITKACEFWNGHREAIKEGMGYRVYSAWLHNLIPIEDDGETLTLACHNKMAGKFVEREHGEQLGQIIDRKIACEVRAWVWEAIRRRDGGPKPPAG